MTAMGAIKGFLIMYEAAPSMLGDELARNVNLL